MNPISGSSSLYSSLTPGNTNPATPATSTSSSSSSSSSSSASQGMQLLTQEVTNELAAMPVQLPTSALQNASPTDLVKISEAAMQYQETSAMFGDAASSLDPTSTSQTDLSSLLSTIGTTSQQASNATGLAALQNDATLMGLPSSTSPTQSLMSLLDPATSTSSSTTATDPLQSLFSTPSSTSSNGLSVLG